MRNLFIGEVDLVCKITKRQLCLKLQFLPNGPNLLHLFWVGNMVHDPGQPPHIICSIHLFYYGFYLLKIILNQINNKNTKICFEDLILMKIKSKISWPNESNSNQGKRAWFAWLWKDFIWLKYQIFHSWILKIMAKNN